MFSKDNVTISDSFLAVRGTWISSSIKLMIVSVYAPQDLSERETLWEYITHMIDSWEGECVILGYFNKVRSEHERFGTIFNDSGAKAFNNFISSAGLIDLPLEALCLDRHLSDYRPIIMRDSVVDYGTSPFRVFHSWFDKDGFDKLVDDSWKNSSVVGANKISLLRKKFQALKAAIKTWCKEDKQRSNESRFSIQSRISELDKLFDKGKSNDVLVNERTSLLKKFHDINARHSLDMAQKAKIRWSIEGDENSKYFHGIINKKRSQLAIRGVLVDGDWIDEPTKVKNEFLNHFSNCFSKPFGPNITLDTQMFKQISFDQNEELESGVTYEEIKRAVWDCSTNKSPGPDGFTFDFIRRYWKTIDQDVVNAAHEFFVSSKFPPGSNSSFITLIPKKQDAKVVKDFRPISLIGSFYKIIAKILANRLSLVMSDLISDVQTAFVSNRQILDGPFILNELISWCKYHKTKAMIFKADFEKAFDLERWDYLDGILSNFGFGAKLRGWIQGCLNSAMGSILVNGSPSSEFKFHKGLKQGDPLSHFLFILGIRIDDYLTLSHLFYADDAVFIGKWDKASVITIVHMLKCFFLASGFKIYIYKSKLIGIGTTQEEINSAANIIGCNTFSTPFNYLGVKVGTSNSRSRFWDEVLAKISSRLSKWKIKTLSIGGRLTLIKSVLSSLPLYQMSIYKAPMGVLHKMESIRRRFFNGVDINERKISMIGWQKILASKGKGGLGVSSFFAQNRALLFKWVRRFRSQETSLWSRFIKVVYGDQGSLVNPGSVARSSAWINIIRELGSLSLKSIDLFSQMKKKVGNGAHTLFWEDSRITDSPLMLIYPRLFALKCNKHATVADKFRDISLIHSFRRTPRGGLEEEQYLSFVDNVDSVIISNSNDRWVWLLDSFGEFSVKSARSFIDDSLLPAVGSPTRWVKVVPIKINIFAWKVCLDKLPMRLNLSLHGIDIPSISCPICSSAGESCSHLLFSCNMAQFLYRKVARWWEVDIPDLLSYEDWLAWFTSLRLPKGFKDVLEVTIAGTGGEAVDGDEASDYENRLLFKKDNNTKQEVDEKKVVEVEDKKKLDEGPITIILKLDLHCEGCAKKVKKSIRYIQGVDSVKADSANNKLTIVGKLDPLYIKERVEHKTKKKVEIISPKPKKDEGGDKKGNEKPLEPQSTTVALKISLHCDGCIQKIKRIISKIDGVESVKPDANKNLVTVKGTMNMKELIPYLKDKLKRNVDIVVPPKKEENKVDEKKDEKKVEGGDNKKEKDGDNDKKKDAVEKSEDGEKKKKNDEAEAAVVGETPANPSRTGYQKKPDGEAKAKVTVAGDGDRSKNADVINRFEHYTHIPHTYTMPMYNQNYHNQDYGISGVSTYGYANEGYLNHGYMMQYPHGPPPPPSPMSIHNPRASETDMFNVENANACSIM
ncbi:RNA-directed DNA polymerase, eukaryota [Tanacetum coccineum]